MSTSQGGAHRVGGSSTSSRSRLVGHLLTATLFWTVFFVMFALQQEHDIVTAPERHHVYPLATAALGQRLGERRGHRRRMTTTTSTTYRHAHGADKAKPYDGKSGLLRKHHDGIIQQQPSRFAYVWLLGGVHPDRHGYKGFLVTMLISMHNLRAFGAQADFVVYVQLSPDHPHNTLSDDETRYLQQSGATIIYLPKPVTESFHQIVYEKLRPLELVQYERVQFLDGDLMPLRNLDYVFQLSMAGKLAPNLMYATRGEPCNAGWFMLQPQAGAWDRLQDVVTAQREAAQDLPYPKFDRVVGWGHSFQQHHDVWQGTRKNGTRWNYHASHSDQGLLFYWLKYVIQDVSIVIGSQVQRWQQSVPYDVHHPMLVDTKPASFWENYSPLPPDCLSLNATVRQAQQQQQSRSSTNVTSKHYCAPAPYRDFAHFAGSSKPWGKPVGRAGTPLLWYQGLVRINDQLDMQLDLSKWTALQAAWKDPPLGRMAMFWHHSQDINTTMMTDTTLNNATIATTAGGTADAAAAAK